MSEARREEAEAARGARAAVAFPTATGKTPAARTLGAWVWALFVLVCLTHLASIAWRGDWPVDTDVMALLPQDTRHHAAEQALARLSDGASRRVVVVLSAPDFSVVRAAAQMIAPWIGDSRGPLAPLPANVGTLRELGDFYAPWRDRLLTTTERERLAAEPPEALARTALHALYRPGPAPHVYGPLADPLGSADRWLAERALATPLRPREGYLWLRREGRELIVLPFELRTGALSVAALEALQPRLDAARALARSAGVELDAAGVAVHAAAATHRAQREMSLIGLGAALGIAAMMWLVFGRLRPLALVLGSVGIGLAVALSLSLLVFGRVHLVTLVFGASLVGVAEDYAIHWLAVRALAAKDAKSVATRAIVPGLWLAFTTSALGYLALALAPFPGLRQMALFAISGLAAALLTVLLWLPRLLGAEPRAGRASQVIARSWRRWPRVTRSPLAALLLLGMLGWLLASAADLRTADDLRALQSSPPELLAQQARVGDWLGEPSPVQFFLVRAADHATLLQREEALVERLRAHAAAGHIGGHRALSDWVPSPTRQAEDAALLAPARAVAQAAIGNALGAADTGPTALAAAPLTLDAWLESPLSAPLRALVLGRIDGELASVVQIQGLTRPEQLPALAALAPDLPGVQWVDRIDDYSRLLREYRVAMLCVLATAVLVVALLLALRYRRRAWRVLAPTLLGMLAVLAFLGWRGEPLQLFHVLGLIVLLGMADDYGIFLLEGAGDDAAWLGIVLGAGNTLLAFGLLAFSATPALAAFGLTLLIGIGVAWLAAPMVADHEGTGARGHVPP
ncbi:MAG: MMPL family transporter [Xanthomonadales bacterium]|nr:MMPL family transporter [Xanthomonadales bacterium]